MRRQKLVVAAILGLFLSLGTIYSVVDPIFESSDELSHYPYVKYMADGRGLPVQRPGEETLWDQEGSQPPLYYALAAALTSWINTDDLPIVRRINPHAQLGVPLGQDNKNMIIHTAREQFPWSGTVLAVHLIRLFSLLLSAGTVFCTYRLASVLFPERPSLALSAMAMNAFIPMFLFISASVNNDNLVILLCSLTLLCLVRVLQRGASFVQSVGMGILIGLACLTKLSALGLVPLTALALALRQMLVVYRDSGRKPDPWQRVLCWARDCAVVFLPALTVAGWWYLRNLRLYGDLTGLASMVDIAGRRQGAPTLFALLGEFQGFRISFWGLFGAVNILLLPTWIYWVLDGFSLLAVTGLGVRVWRTRGRGWRDNAITRAGLLMLIAWVAIESVALIRWTMMTMASQGRLLFPAISAICLFWALGLAKETWSGAKNGLVLRGSRPMGLAMLFLLAATAPFVAIRPTYARPPILTAADVPSSARAFNVTYGGVMRLLAYELRQAEVRPGETVAVTLYWQALAPMKEDYSLYIHLFGWQYQPLGQRDSYPGGGNYQTSFWSPGQVVRDTYLVRVDPELAGPVAAEIEVGLYRLETMEKLTALDGQGREVGRPILTRVKVAAPAHPVQPPHPLEANFDNCVRLIGYDLAAFAVRPGAELPLTLYWQVTGRLGRDYTVFIHLLGEDDVLGGQGDAPPMGNFYPTSYWGPGETLADEKRLVVRQDARPGAYRILIGLYDPATNQRLPVLDAGGKPSGDSILLATIRVEHAE